MSYYKPSFSQTLAMARGGRGYSSPRGNSYRGSSRGSSSWGGGGRGGYSGSSGGRFSSSFSSSMDSRNSFDGRKYGTSDRFSRPHGDDYKYRSDSGYSGRDGGRRSPERKRMRLEAPSSRHESSYGYGPSRHESQSSYSDRRGYSGDRHSASTPFSRRDDFRRPAPPPSRGSYRGRLSSRGARGSRLRDRPIRRRLLDTSYAVRKRGVPSRTTDYARRLKISRMRSAIARRVTTKRRPSEKDSDDEKPDKEKKSKDDDAKDSESKDTTEKTIKKEKEGSVKDDKSESGHEKPKKKFIRLNCPHCGIHAVTFRRYEMHLSSKSHLFAMRRVALQQKSILGQMRQAQRNTQNELEKSSDELTTKTNFCPLCKLNYKQKKAVHQLSESHKNMKKFLMPYCKACNITFKSPMIYESHCCSIEHIKRKQRVETTGSDVSAEEDNLENFTTIDSVGDGDGSEVEDKKEEAKEPPVNVGIEQIRKVEAHYCDLCKMYLTRAGSDDPDLPKILTRHCKQRVHMQRYIRLKEHRDLEKRAEKLQRKEMAEKEGKDKKDDSSIEVKNEKDPEKTGKVPDDEEARDDKLWADVDKDLGDILAEAETGTKSSDEDEDSHVNGERYDRFKLSEKNGDEKIKKEDEEPKTADKKLDEKEIKEEKK